MLYAIIIVIGAAIYTITRLADHRSHEKQLDALNVSWRMRCDLKNRLLGEAYDALDVARDHNHWYVESVRLKALYEKIRDDSIAREVGMFEIEENYQQDLIQLTEERDSLTEALAVLREEWNSYLRGRSNKGAVDFDTVWNAAMASLVKMPDAPDPANMPERGE